MNKEHTVYNNIAFIVIIMVDKGITIITYCYCYITDDYCLTYEYQLWDVLGGLSHLEIALCGFCDWLTSQGCQVS